MEQWLFKVASDFTPGGVGVWLLVVMVAVYLLREWRETRKLSLEDRIARRDGYAHQVEMLMAENRNLMNGMRLLREEHDAHRRLCQQETDQLRHMVVALENTVEALKRNLAVAAIEIAKRGGKLNFEEVEQ